MSGNGLFMTKKIIKYLSVKDSTLNFITLFTFSPKNKVANQEKDECLGFLMHVTFKQAL